jgi:DNA invertase Pin-like site-specific DNA recombinase
MMLERQREGVAKAKAEGKYKGRVPTARLKADRIRALREQGLTTGQIALDVGVSRRSVFRVLAD